MEALKQAMFEYAQAIRGDWSDFDGRSERHVIESWIAELDNPDETHTVEYWRNCLNLCSMGYGHWCGPWKGFCEVGDPEWNCNCPCTEGKEEQ